MIIGIFRNFTMEPEKSCLLNSPHSFKLDELPVLEENWIRHPPPYSLTECT